MSLTIYKSSAGSGKTFTLVRLYLEKVIRSPLLFRSILAITFTNKATEEMKTRIIRELDDLASGNKSTQLDHLKETLTLTEKEIRKRAHEVLLGILYDYSSFSVSTIDSYFQVLSRTLARELDLPSKYDIELDLDAVCDAVSDLLFAEVGKDDSITGWLQELLLDRLEQGKSWSIHADLRKMTLQVLTRSEALQHATDSNPEIIIHLIRALKKIRNDLERDLREIGKEALNEIANAGFTIENFAYGKSGAVAYFFKIADHLANSAYYKPGTRVKNACDDASTMLSAANKKNDTLLSFVNETLHPLLCSAADLYLENEKKYISAVEALKHIYLAGISGALNEKIKKFRDEFQLYLLSDTTRMLREIVKDDDASFIYEKTGNSYRHLFIDEFQDTSNEQWQILRPMVLNSLSNGNDVLVVGDAKQSIYRWRGGNMHLILEGVKNDLRSFNSVTQESKLDTNYRSLSNIIEFNNRFFNHASTLLSAKEFANAPLIAKAYGKEEIEQKVKPGSEKREGFVEFVFFPSPRKVKGEKSSTDEGEEKWKEKALAEMNKNISSLLQRGYHLRDIAVLIRTGAHEKEIADYLYKKGEYDFISGNSLLLTANNKIRFIINCFHLLFEEKNSILHYEINNFIDGEIRRNEKEIPFDADSILKDKESWSNTSLLLWKSQLIAMPVDMAFYRILHLANLKKTDIFIDKLNDILMDFTSGKGTGCAEFIKWWDENAGSKKWSVEIPQGSDAIQILSIHRSKGLQFPVVLIPFLDWPIVPNRNDILWAKTKEEPFAMVNKLPVSPSPNLANSVFDEEYITERGETYLDNLNLLYVAFTRAENELHVFANRDSFENTIANLALATLQSQGEGQNKSDGEEIVRFEFGEPYHPLLKEKKLNENSLYQPQTVSAGELPSVELTSSAMLSLRTQYKSEEIIFGNHVHEVLSMIKNIDDLEDAMHRLTVSKSLSAFPDKIKDIRSAVENVWQLMNERGWNDPSYNIANEQEFSDEEGKTRRTDRILYKDDHAIVIDFKTGGAKKSYHKQVKEYCDLLLKSGFKKVEGYLIYTTSAVIEDLAYPDKSL